MSARRNVAIAAASLVLLGGGVAMTAGAAQRAAQQPDSTPAPSASAGSLLGGQDPSQGDPGQASPADPAQAAASQAGDSAQPSDAPAVAPSVDPATVAPAEPTAQPSPPGLSEQGIPVEQQLPPSWPVSLPLPPNSRLVETDLNGYQRYLLVKQTSVPLLGGELLTGLRERGWDVTTVGTPRSATLVGRKGDESVTILVRDNADTMAWSSMEVIYQSASPQQPDPTPTPTDDPLSAKG